MNVKLFTQKSHPVFLDQHGVQLDAVNDVVELPLAASVDGLRDGTVENVDGGAADAVAVAVAVVVGQRLGLQAFEQILQKFRA